ncbi:MAG TPA: hypothetical protein VI112_07385 [Bacteroidia bacterium]|jgi:hypothetical protein
MNNTKKTALASVLFLLALITVAHSQNCMTFQDMGKNGVRLTQLDSLYPNALKTETFEGVFPEGKKLKKFDKAWAGFYEELMNYFSKSGLKWDKPTYCFNKIYFDADGNVQYWFFNFMKEDNIPADVQAKYLQGIKEFSKTHQIKIKAGTKFSQCASVTFVNADELNKK